MAAKKKAGSRRKPAKPKTDPRDVAKRMLGGIEYVPFKDYPEIKAIVVATFALLEEDYREAKRTRRPRRYENSSPSALHAELRGEFEYPFGLTKFRIECEALDPVAYKKFWSKAR